MEELNKLPFELIHIEEFVFQFMEYLTTVFNFVHCNRENGISTTSDSMVVKVTCDDFDRMEAERKCLIELVEDQIKCGRTVDGVYDKELGTYDFGGDEIVSDPGHGSYHTCLLLTSINPFHTVVLIIRTLFCVFCTIGLYINRTPLFCKSLFLSFLTTPFPSSKHCTFSIPPSCMFPSLLSPSSTNSCTIFTLILCFPTNNLQLFQLYQFLFE